jgi:hypothetical protein
MFDNSNVAFLVKYADAGIQSEKHDDECDNDPFRGCEDCLHSWTNVKGEARAGSASLDTERNDQ